MRSAAVVAIGVGALAGCGGGSGGDGAPQATLATITSANAPVIAQSVMASSLDGGDLGAFAGFGSPAAPLAPGDAALVHAKVAEVQHAGLEALMKPGQTGIVEAPIGPETTACTAGGTVTVSGNIANPDTLSPNDTIVFEFQSCVEGEATVNGRFSMRVTSFSGDLSSEAFSFGVNVELTAFRVTVGAETATANGTIAMSINATAGNVTTTLTSSSLSISDGSSSHTLTSYSITETLDTASLAFTVDVSGTLTSSAFSGAVTFDTTAVLQGVGDEFPFAGQVLITGANGTTIRVIVLDSTFVRLEVDSNGDGTIDATIDRSWDELV